MAHRLAPLAAAIAGLTSLAVQSPARGAVPRLWTDEALAGWALPIAGVKATPKYYTEAEYYAAPVDEVRTYPVYIKSREPEGYRDWIRKQGPQPLIDPATLTSEANWLAAGREVFDGLHLAEFRTADPRGPWPAGICFSPRICACGQTGRCHTRRYRRREYREGWSVSAS